MAAIVGIISGCNHNYIIQYTLTKYPNKAVNHPFSGNHIY